MTWNLDADRPIYLQLLTQLEHRIVSGEYLPGQRLPSVRELATDASVNPNTMQRALGALEEKGLVCTQRTAGRTITEDKTVIATIRQELATTEMRKFLRTMRLLGHSNDEITILLTSILKEDVA